MKDNVIEQAEIALEYWGSTAMWGRLIERDINDNDLEALEFHVNEANAQMSMCQEFNQHYDARYRLLDALQAEAKV